MYVRMCKKDDICWQRRLNHSRVGGGIALRGVYPTQPELIFVFVYFPYTKVLVHSAWLSQTPQLCKDSSNLAKILTL